MAATTTFLVVSLSSMNCCSLFKNKRWKTIYGGGINISSVRMRQYYWATKGISLYYWAHRGPVQRPTSHLIPLRELWEIQSLNPPPCDHRLHKVDTTSPPKLRRVPRWFLRLLLPKNFPLLCWPNRTERITERAMNTSMVELNPTKTLNTKTLLNNSIFSKSATTRITFKSNEFRFPVIRASVMRKEHESLGNALLNSSRKHQVLDTITTSLSNCLSETNLHFTVPSLKSKIRGKVYHISTLIYFFIDIYVIVVLCNLVIHVINISKLSLELQNISQVLSANASDIIYLVSNVIMILLNVHSSYEYQ